MFCESTAWHGTPGSPAPLADPAFVRMKWSILTIGKPSLGYARDGVDLYLHRLRPLAPVEWLPLKAGGGSEAESQRLWDRSEGSLRLALDERGDLQDTMTATGIVRDWRDRGTKRASILIGGAGGHCGWLRDRANAVWSLSRLTLQHELALVVVLEQLYRIHSILAGSPYHREG